MADKETHKKSKGRWWASAIMAGALSFPVGVVATTTSAQPAHATCYAGGLGFTNINIQPVSVGNPGSYWYQVLGEASRRWNNTGVAQIATATQSSGKYTAGQYSGEYWDAVYGEYAPSGTRGLDRGFVIRINAKAIARDEPNPNNHWAWNTAITVHEIGHALSLADNPATAQFSIMKYPPNNRWGSYANPTSYDIQEVRRCQ